ncbi:MAG: SMP-30/gluconolactonase/LRE family protein [Mucilaginibacter sp.]
MKKTLFIFSGLLCLLTVYSCRSDFGIHPVGGDPSDPTNLVSASSHGQLDTLATGFSFTEGPAVDKHGNIFFTDQPNDKIYKWNVATKMLSTFLTGTGRSNGMAFDRDGYLIACADMYGELWRIAPDGSHTVLVNNYNGKLLNGPNDVWINPVTGGMYITDPIFPRSYWAPGDPRQQPWEPTHSEQAATGKGGYVYYLAPGSHTLVRVVTDAMGWDSDSWPNGVVGTPDGRKLYVNKWKGDNMGGTWVFDIRTDGTLTNMHKFIDMGGDGMSMDERRNIYISNGLGVTTFDPTGTKILSIPMNGGATNNVFGGENEKTLFITSGSGNLTSLKMNVRGVEKY